MTYRKLENHETGQLARISDRLAGILGIKCSSVSDSVIHGKVRLNFAYVRRAKPELQFLGTLINELQIPREVCSADWCINHGGYLEVGIPINALADKSLEDRIAEQITKVGAIISDPQNALKAKSTHFQAFHLCKKNLPDLKPKHQSYGSGNIHLQLRSDAVDLASIPEVKGGVSLPAGALRDRLLATSSSFGVTADDIIMRRGWGKGEEYPVVEIIYTNEAALAFLRPDFDFRGFAAAVKSTDIQTAKPITEKKVHQHDINRHDFLKTL